MGQAAEEAESNRRSGGTSFTADRYSVPLRAENNKQITQQMKIINQKIEERPPLD